MYGLGWENYLKLVYGFSFVKKKVYIYKYNENSSNVSQELFGLV